MFKNFVIVSTLAFALAAPAANAHQLAQPRDLGAGRLIAAQGNLALQMIKAELKETLKAFAPALPSKPAARTVVLAPVNGSAAGVRCAE